MELEIKGAFPVKYVSHLISSANYWQNTYIKIPFSDK